VRPPLNRAQAERLSVRHVTKSLADIPAGYAVAEIAAPERMHRGLRKKYPVARIRAALTPQVLLEHPDGSWNVRTVVW